jgi:hypothetical protein
VSSPPFHLRRDPVSETSCFLVSRIPDDGKVQKIKKKTVILCVISVWFRNFHPFFSQFVFIPSLLLFMLSSFPALFMTYVLYSLFSFFLRFFYMQVTHGSVNVHNDRKPLPMLHLCNVACLTEY